MKNMNDKQPTAGMRAASKLRKIYGGDATTLQQVAQVIDREMSEQAQADNAELVAALKETRSALLWAHQEWLKYRLPSSERTPKLDKAADDSAAALTRHTQQ